MYSTVINNHSTVIRHPFPQPTNVGVSSEVARAFAAQQTDEPFQQKNGAYSIPVKISQGAIKDATLSGYETPNFIHKGERKVEETVQEGLSNSDPSTFLKSNMEKDITQFVSQFDNAKDKNERLQACKLKKNI